MELITFHTADSTAHCALLRDEAAINSVLCKSHRNPNVRIAAEIGSEICNVLGSVAVKFILLLPIIYLFKFITINFHVVNIRQVYYFDDYVLTVWIYDMSVCIDLDSSSQTSNKYY